MKKTNKIDEIMLFKQQYLDLFHKQLKSSKDPAVSVAGFTAAYAKIISLSIKEDKIDHFLEDLKKSLKVGILKEMGENK